MNAKDLMIGNYVTNAGGKVVEVTSAMLADIDNKLIIVNPIPITNELLLKNGFVKGEDLEYIKRGFHLENRNDCPYLPDEEKQKLKDSFGVWFVNSYTCDIKYLHEFQNIGRILKNELTWEHLQEVV